ncbi:MAG: hypothetical protein ACXWT3_13320 [Methylococcaceae bacterium]
MFGKLIRGLTASGNGAKAIHVLSKTYSLTISHPDQLNMMKRIYMNFGELYNEHEMAVQFLAEFSNMIKIDHPKAKREIEKYIRMSKGAYNRGLVESDVVMEELFEVARERFNINPDDIEAA